MADMEPTKAESIDRESSVADDDEGTVAMRQCITRLSSECAQLRGENEKLTLQLKRISGGTEIEELESLEVLKEAKAATDARVQELQVRLDRTSQRSADLESDLKAHVQRNQKLATENQQYLAESQEVSQNSRNTSSLVETLTNRNNDLERDGKELSTANVNITEQVKRLQKILDEKVRESATAIVELRKERDFLKEDNSELKSKSTSLADKLRQAQEDIETDDDHMQLELEKLKTQLQVCKEELQRSEEQVKDNLKHNENQNQEFLVMKNVISDYKNSIDNLNNSTADASKQANDEIENLTTARNTSEAEVVRLKLQLNSLHPLIKADGSDVPPGSFSFSDVIDVQKELVETKSKLQQIQQFYKRTVESKDSTDLEINQLRSRMERLSSEVIEGRAAISLLTTERDNAVNWCDKNKIIIEKSEGLSKTNEVLCYQLQVLLHEVDNEVDVSVLDSLQQRNVELESTIYTVEQERDVVENKVRSELESLYSKEVAEFNTHINNLQNSLAIANERRCSAEEQSKRLVETLESCNGHRQLLVSSEDSQSAMPQTNSESRLDSNEAGGATAGEKQLLLDDIAERTEQIESLKEELLELRRQCDTIEAARQHIQVLHRSAESNCKHIEIEKNIYKDQSNEASRHNDEVIALLTQVQSRLKTSELDRTSLDVQLKTCKEEISRLRTANENLSKSSTKMSDIVTKVDGVRTFISDHNATIELELKKQRDEARQTLSQKEAELQSLSNNLREQRTKYDQETMEITAELATTKKQLTDLKSIVDTEKEQHRLQLLRNKELATELERYESERKLLKQSDVEGGADYLQLRSNDARLHELQISLDSEKSKSNSLSATIGSLRQGMKTLETMTSTAQAELSDKTSQITKWKDIAESAVKERDNQKSSLESKTKDLNEREVVIAKNELEQREHNEKLRNTNTNLQKELDDGEANRVSALQKCKEAEDIAEKMREKYEEAIISKGELTKALQNAQEQDPQITYQRGSENEQIQRLQVELDKVHHIISLVEPSGELRNTDAMAIIDATRAENRNLQQRLREETIKTRVVTIQNDQLRKQALMAASRPADPKLERRIQNLKEDKHDRKVVLEKYVIYIYIYIPQSKLTGGFLSYSKTGHNSNLRQPEHNFQTDNHSLTK